MRRLIAVFLGHPFICRRIKAEHLVCEQVYTCVRVPGGTSCAECSASLRLLVKHAEEIQFQFSGFQNRLLVTGTAYDSRRRSPPSAIEAHSNQKLTVNVLQL